MYQFIQNLWGDEVCKAHHFIFALMIVGLSMTLTYTARADDVDFYVVPPIGGIDYQNSYFNILTPNGLVAGGSTTNHIGSVTYNEGLIWTADGGAQSVGILSLFTSGSGYSSIYYLSDDGNVAFGVSSNSDGIYNWTEAFRWTEASGMEGLGFLAPNTYGYGYSYPFLMSLDGSVVAGQSSNSDGIYNWTEAFRWTEASGMEGLGFLAPYTIGYGYSSPSLMSLDGSVVAGQSSNSDGINDWNEAFRWTEASGMEGLGFLAPYTIGYGYSSPSLMSLDGSVIVGQSSNSDGINDWDEAFRWTEANGMAGLGFLAPTTYGYGYSYPSLMSLDGSVIVGQSSNSDGINDWDEAFRWTEANGMEGLGFLAPYTFGYGYSYPSLMSLDGSVIVGDSSNSDGINDWNEAFRWTEASGMEGLGFLAPFTYGYGYSYPSLMSLDGSVIVGDSSNSDGIIDWYEPFRWTEDAGMQTIGEWIGPDVDLTGLRFVFVGDMSADGNVLVGQIQIDGGASYSAFYARKGGLISPEILAASLYSMLPFEAAQEAETAGLLSGIADVASHSDCDHEVSAHRFCVFGSASAGQVDDDALGTDNRTTWTGGVQTALNSHWRIGIAGTRAVRHVDGLAFGTRHRSVTGGLNFFVKREPDQRGLELTASALLAQIDLETSRGYLNGNDLERATSSTDGQAMGALARAGWRFGVSPTASLMPFGEATILRTEFDAFAEQEGPFPLSAEAQDRTSLRTRLGAEGAIDIKSHTTLWASGAWAHRSENTTLGLNGTVQDIGDFMLPGVAVPEDWAEGSLGLTATPMPSVSFGASVTGRSDAVDMPEVEGRFTVSIGF